MHKSAIASHKQLYDAQKKTLTRDKYQADRVGKVGNSAAVARLGKKPNVAGFNTIRPKCPPSQARRSDCQPDQSNQLCQK